jgi:hypothetical protein
LILRTRFSNLVILNTVSSPVRTAVCQCLFGNRVPWFFKYNGATDLNFNMNKRQGTLFNFGVKKCRIEGACLILVLRNVVLKVLV